MFKIIGGERIKGLIILKLLIKKLIKTHLLQFSPRGDDENGVEFAETPIEDDEQVVPYDVKEGHFAIFAVNTKEQRKRFVLELNWLKSPTLLRLLRKAEEEYGFRQKGVLEIPCPPEELDKIILQLKIEKN
ncbi:hypothetical protein HAX54_014804 [Datura stramonium]|uniref:Small auxin up regulated protein n=1 Tax=Datura stramonium TaxID=4076 RepID=A0ABS8TNR4_DATST|nr:hypothetical protein [Datura stramonium]